ARMLDRGRGVRRRANTAGEGVSGAPPAGSQVIDDATEEARLLSNFRDRKGCAGDCSGRVYSSQLLICNSATRFFDSASTNRCANWMLVMSGTPKSAAFRRIR